ncbi:MULTISPECIES: DUF2200 domain-containing protein [Cellulomonas]|jgi:hypothetical protein|uniref:DUF2200 domain-containing protein n=1 Tax=Cellulomonas TaxID=1707 RepID=UPI00073C827C|nr:MULTISPECIES: DUF2200 domain-containing protein [Cellulomonas]KSW19931.1 hypothetical protein ATM99_16005 [Cellulomonas sp. B6]UCN16208.1 DUF2200 domain-containing protein [Cellulomonas iranensis]
MAGHRIFGTSVASVYPLYVAKVERKGRDAADVDRVITWLTGYDADGLARALADEVTFEEFFAAAPRMNPDASLITGLICGIRVEDVEDPLMQRIRYLDKLVDEVARGKKMSSILRGSGAGAA